MGLYDVCSFQPIAVKHIAQLTWTGLVTKDKAGHLLSIAKYCICIIEYLESRLIEVDDVNKVKLLVEGCLFQPYAHFT